MAGRFSPLWQQKPRPQVFSPSTLSTLWIPWGHIWDSLAGVSPPLQFCSLALSHGISGISALGIPTSLFLSFLFPSKLKQHKFLKELPSPQGGFQSNKSSCQLELCLSNPKQRRKASLPSQKFPQRNLAGWENKPGQAAPSLPATKIYGIITSR